MKAIGRVEVPNEAFVSALKLDDWADICGSLFWDRTDARSISSLHHRQLSERDQTWTNVKRQYYELS